MASCRSSAMTFHAATLTGTHKIVKMVGANVRKCSSSTSSRLKAFRHRPSSPSVFSMESPSAASSSMPRSNLKSDSEKTCGMVVAWSTLVLGGHHKTTQNPSCGRSGRHESKRVCRAADTGIDSPAACMFITAQPAQTLCHVELHSACGAAGQAAPWELEGAGSGEVAAQPQQILAARVAGPQAAHPVGSAAAGRASVAHKQRRRCHRRRLRATWALHRSAQGASLAGLTALGATFITGCKIADLSIARVQDACISVLQNRYACAGAEPNDMQCRRHEWAKLGGNSSVQLLAHYGLWRNGPMPAAK